MNAVVSARGSRTPNTSAKSRIGFSKITRWPTSFLRADQRAHRISLQRLRMYGLEEASAGQVRQPSRIVAVGLVGRKRLERLVGRAAPRRVHPGHAARTAGDGYGDVTVKAMGSERSRGWRRCRTRGPHRRGHL
jgi:hypothetical protein